MVLVHHPVLAVNSWVPDETVDIWAERGWIVGLHPDTDPDDDGRVPRVLAQSEPEPEPEPPKRPTRAKASKE